MSKAIEDGKISGLVMASLRGMAAEAAKDIDLNTPRLHVFVVAGHLTMAFLRGYRLACRDHGIPEPGCIDSKFMDMFDAQQEDHEANK